MDLDENKIKRYNGIMNEIIESRRHKYLWLSGRLYF